MRKKTFHVLFGLSALVFCSTAVFAADPIQVLKLTGSATEFDGKKQIALKEGSIIQPRHRVQLGQASAMIVRVGRDVVTKTAGKFSGTFEPSKDGKDWDLNLQSGIAASAVKNPEKRSDHFRVRTRSAVMGVRGTVFFVETAENKPDFLCTCTGTVTVESPQRKVVRSITTTHHDFPVTIQTNAQTKALSTHYVPMGNSHSDADVAYLQGLLNQK